MRILLVTHLFPPDSGVSTIRMKFLFDQLTSAGHDVEVLKLGGETCFSSGVKLIERIFFEPFLSAVLNRRKIRRCVGPLLPQYDLVLVSATPYGLYEVAHAAKHYGVPFILDLRDLPDLTTSEQRKLGRPLLWLRLKEWLLNSYIANIARHARALLCVGSIATALVQEKLKKHNVKVVNVHNGFEMHDLAFVQTEVPQRLADDSERHLTVGCVGNIFTFRDTDGLRAVLKRLNERKEKVTLMHWGKMQPELARYVSTLSNIEYVQMQSVPRRTLLTELHRVDCFLLPCSEDLIWEPTTSVFDYILFDKPVIFAGLRNNEAYCTLAGAESKIVELDDIETYRFQESGGSRSAHVLRRYSREHYLPALLQIVEAVRDARCEH